MKNIEISDTNNKKIKNSSSYNPSSIAKIKTIKDYIFFNRNFLNFTGKSPSEITDNNIKEYLVYLYKKTE